jgi:hypothetical protein
MSDAAYTRNMYLIGAIVLVVVCFLLWLFWNAFVPKYQHWRELREIARRDRERDRYAMLYWPRPQPSSAFTCARCHARLATVTDALAHRCVGTYEDLQ